MNESFKRIKLKSFVFSREVSHIVISNKKLIIIASLKINMNFLDFVPKLKTGLINLNIESIKNLKSFCTHRRIKAFFNNVKIKVMAKKH